MDLIIFAISFLFGALVLKKIFPPRGVEQLTTDELRLMLKDKENNDHYYIDVRTPREYERLHIFGFKNIPLYDLKKEVHTLPKDKKIVVVCQTGMRGNEACKRLKRRGFTDLANVRGGVSTWEPHG
ncbi:rhodanese-like domain-containing protein [Virgibacillus sp. W0181]|uniref:rhodanese-like domain-containing protein n=1 Tax=Virgibacillus sp. W0181 TaxID=3391581 RepID=UPI003F466CFD